MNSLVRTFILGLAAAALSTAQSDPGVRGGTPGAGGPLPGLTVQQLAPFNEAKAVFQEVDSVAGTISGEDGKGLGPGFNMNSCVGGHKHPADAGSSPARGLAIIDFDYVDTSGEPADQSAVHRQRLQALMAVLLGDLAAAFRLVPVACGAAPCTLAAASGVNIPAGEPAAGEPAGGGLAGGLSAGAGAVFGM